MEREYVGNIHSGMFRQSGYTAPGNTCISRFGKCIRSQNDPLRFDAPKSRTKNTSLKPYAKDDLDLLSSQDVYHRSLLFSSPSSTTQCVKCKGPKDKSRKQHNTLEPSSKTVSCQSYSDRLPGDSSVTIDDTRSIQSGYNSNFCGCVSCISHRLNRSSKSKMLRLLGKTLILCLLISCGAFVIGYHNGSEDEIQIGGPDELSMANKFKSISMQDFSRNLHSTRSHYDVVRMFLKDRGLSSEEIDRMLQDQEEDRYTAESKREYDYYSDGYYDENEDIGDTMRKAFLHYEEVSSGPFGVCRDPKPELVRAQDYGDLHKQYIPMYTTIHKCRNITGCCWDESQECGPEKIQVIKKPFIVLERDRNQLSFGNGNGPTSTNVEWLFFLNETECKCQTINRLPECTKRCPYPFIMTQPDEECLCDCMKDSPLCQRIKYGKEPLDEEALDCVKSGECLPPVCAEGEFDMRKGKGYCDGTSGNDLEIHRLNYKYKHRNRHHNRHTKQHNGHKGKGKKNAS